MDFEIIFAEDLGGFCDISGIVGGVRKAAVSFANDYEDEKWRSDRFLELVWNNVAETALSSSERSALVNKPMTVLAAAARKLRLTDATKDPGKGSEIAEILLYAVMKHHYGALSAVPKIFYKQNSNDYAKGADSVHIVVHGDEFSLWLGEAKFYRSITDVRLKTIVRSVGEMLGSGKLRKENSIITNLKELDEIGISNSLAKKIRNTLAERESIDSIKPLINVPILLLHQCEITKSHKKFDAAYKAELASFHKARAASYFAMQAGKLAGSITLYDSIRFHLILIPVPEKKVLVDRFIEFAKQSIGESP